MGDTCVYCSLTYEELRTGLTYADVYEQFWSGSDDSSTWVNKRRNTILGRWREIKLDMWEKHIVMCEREAEHCANLALSECAADAAAFYETSHDHRLEAVPF